MQPNRCGSETKRLRTNGGAQKPAVNTEQSTEPDSKHRAGHLQCSLVRGRNQRGSEQREEHLDGVHGVWQKSTRQQKQLQRTKRKANEVRIGVL